MPKYDYVKMNADAIAKTDESTKARTVTQQWLAEPDHIEQLLEIVSGGESLRRFCEEQGISYSVVQRALTADALEPRYRSAQEEQAEHLLGEMQRISQRIEAGKLDGKDGGVILKNLEWRVTKLNQRRFSDRVVQETHHFDHTAAQLEAVRALARKQRPAIEGQVIRPALSLEQAVPMPIVPDLSREPVLLADKLAALPADRRERVEARAQELIADEAAEPESSWRHGSTGAAQPAFRARAKGTP